MPLEATAGGSTSPAPDASADARAGRDRTDALRRTTWQIDVAPAVPFPGRHAVAVDVVLPDPRLAGASPIALACLPGGFLSRRYFDLDPGGGRGFSFAEAMAAQGFAILAFDYLGTGGSTKPEPVSRGYALGAEAIARINQYALERALEHLATGDAETGLPPLAVEATVGVGHSMGSMLTVEQQALARPHRALVLFSFTTRGVPAFLNDAQRALAGDPARTRRALATLARATWGTPYPERADDAAPGRRAAFGVGTAPEQAEALLHDASTRLLGLAGLLSMIPDGYAPAADAIDVPVHVLLGDHDLHDASGLREQLPNAPRVEITTLPDCWHCHFVANGRERIGRAVGDWIRRTLAPMPPAKAVARP